MRQEDHTTSHFRLPCQLCTIWRVSTRGDYSPLLLVIVFGAFISCAPEYTHILRSCRKSSRILHLPHRIPLALLSTLITDIRRPQAEWISPRFNGRNNRQGRTFLQESMQIVSTVRHSLLRLTQENGAKQVRARESSQKQGSGGSQGTTCPVGAQSSTPSGGSATPAPNSNKSGAYGARRVMGRFRWYINKNDGWSMCHILIYKSGTPLARLPASYLRLYCRHPSPLHSHLPRAHPNHATCPRGCHGKHSCLRKQEREAVPCLV